MAKIGIDLGTTNSLVSVWTENGPQIIQNGLGENMTPSVISIDDGGDVLVGEVAKERLLTHPNNTASNFKRSMGTNKVYRLGDHTFDSTQLSSLVLKSLKQDAEVHLGEEVVDAIISVPAYFNDSQRKATKEAAELAGLKVERLISEPTAAAIAYGLDKTDSDSVFLVFDLGGGTFDVSILELFDGIMQVRAVAGDNHLGGEDFTKALYNYFLDAHKLERSVLDRKTISKIRKACEDCKKALSDSTEHNITVNIDEMTLEETITRNKFEKIVEPLIDRLTRPMLRALRDADLSVDELDAVILIGGATRMQVIRSTVSKLFRRYPHANINPDETVALGGAVQAALKNRDEILKEIILTDVCPYTLGISVLKDGDDQLNKRLVYSPIIDRNSPIPISRVKRFCTVHKGQTRISIDVYQGESRDVENNILLGTVDINVPLNDAEKEVVDVRFTYDINGILEVMVTSVSTGEKKIAVINNYDNDISEEELAKRNEALAHLKIHPRDRMENRLLLAKAERLYEECLGDLREHINICMTRFEKILNTQDEKVIIEAREQFKEELNSIDSYRG